MIDAAKLSGLVARMHAKVSDLSLQGKLSSLKQG